MSPSRFADSHSHPLSSSEERSWLDAVHRVQAVISFDLEGQILEANSNFLDVTGYEASEIIGKHHRIFCDPSYAKSSSYREFWQKLARGEFDSGVYKRRTKSGREFWIQASYNPIFDADRRVVKVVKFATDITEARQRDTEFAGKVAAINRSQAVIEFDLEGNVISANDNFLHLLGYTLREIKGKHHRLFCDPEFVTSREYTDFWADLHNGTFRTGRFKRVGKFGQLIWIQATYNPIFDADGSIAKIVKFATDITAQVRREQEISAKTATMNESISNLLSSIQAIGLSTRDTSQLASRTQEEADKGHTALRKVISAMTDIQASAHDVQRIVDVIGEISNQTNLLAFNAAIEAARAGEHGVGFSVVAEEVRRLAEKSSQAAQEIAKLIHTAVSHAESGAIISGQALSSFEEIATGVKSTTASISAINQATDEQTMSAKRFADTIRELSLASQSDASSERRPLAVR